MKVLIILFFAGKDLSSSKSQCTNTSTEPTEHNYRFKSARLRNTQCQKVSGANNPKSAKKYIFLKLIIIPKMDFILYFFSKGNVQIKLYQWLKSRNVYNKSHFRNIRHSLYSNVPNKRRASLDYLEPIFPSRRSYFFTIFTK